MSDDDADTAASTFAGTLRPSGVWCHTLQGESIQPQTTGGGGSQYSTLKALALMLMHSTAMLSMLVMKGI